MRTVCRGTRAWSAARRALPAVMAALILAGIWEAVVSAFRVPPWLLPAPSRILLEIVVQRRPLFTHSMWTLYEALIGLALAVALGVGLGALVHQIRILRRSVYPLLVLSQTVPLVVLAPLLVIWFGYGLAPKIIVVVLACFFPVVVSTVTGLESADPDLIRLFKAMGAGPARIFSMVRLPSALPGILSGTRVAATYSVMAAVVGEWMGSDRGLGVYIVRSAHSFLTARVFAGIVLVSLFSVVLFEAVGRIEHVAVYWRRDETSDVRVDCATD